MTEAAAGADGDATQKKAITRAVIYGENFTKRFMQTKSEYVRVSDLRCE